MPPLIFLINYGLQNNIFIIRNPHSLQSVYPLMNTFTIELFLTGEKESMIAVIYYNA